MAKLRLAGVEKESIVDGPGIRYTIFTQGCAHNCIGCHNPSTHNFNGGYEIETSVLLDDILKYTMIDGITLSGGDPMYQAKECLELVTKLKENNINIICYTGFTFEEIIKGHNKYQIELLKSVDILVDGKFVEEEKDLRLPFMGSRNQRMIDVSKSLISKSIVIYDPDNEYTFELRHAI